MALIIIIFTIFLLQFSLSFKLLSKLSKNYYIMKMMNTDTYTSTNTYFSKFSIKQWGLFDEVIRIRILTY